MATTETIIIAIDDTELQSVMITMSPVTSRLEKLRYDIGTADLPTINRELRLIAGQVPGLREAIAYWYRIRRLQRGVVVGGASFYLTLIATAIVLLKKVQQYQRDIERREREYESRISRARGFTSEQYDVQMNRWEEYMKGMPP